MVRPPYGVYIITMLQIWQQSQHTVHLAIGSVPEQTHLEMELLSKATSVNFNLIALMPISTTSLGCGADISFKEVPMLQTLRVLNGIERWRPLGVSSLWEAQVDTHWRLLFPCDETLWPNSLDDTHLNNITPVNDHLCWKNNPIIQGRLEWQFLSYRFQC